MKKFKKGDYVIATKCTKRKIYRGGYGDNPVVVEDYKDNSYMSYPSEIIHASKHHYFLRTKYGKDFITIDEANKRGFVRVTKKMVDLLKDDI